MPWHASRQKTDMEETHNIKRNEINLKIRKLNSLIARKS